MNRTAERGLHDSRTGRVVRGLGALILLITLIIGVPAILFAVAGSPIPGRIPTLDELHSLLATRDDGHAFLVALTTAGWAGWATFVLSVLVELLARMRRQHVPRLPLLGWSQHSAGLLVSAAMALLPAGIAAAAPSPPPPPTAVSIPPPPALGTASPPQTTTTASPSESTTDTNHDHPRAGLRTYRVQGGDSLWRIAEQELGDPARYREIAALNAGRTMADGRTFDPDKFIYPDWMLYLPDSNPSTVQHRPTHTVRAGETLWGIAETELGDPTRYPEIYALSTTTTQADGETLTDPDLIRPGWQLRLPPAHLRNEHPSQPAPSQSVTPTGPVRPTSPSPATAHPEVPPTTPHQAPRESHEATEHPAAQGQSNYLGYGAVLAAGVLAAIGARRIMQQRRRRPGHRIALPDQPSDTELAMRAENRPGDVAILDRALRLLNTELRAVDRVPPAVLAAQLTAETLDLHLAEPGTAPPSPFQSSDDERTWHLDLQDTPTEDSDTATPPPYPTLVTLGQDDTGALWLLNLEQVTAVTVVGDDDHLREVLTALALELATTTWADELTLTCLGLLDEVPEDLGNAHIQHTATIDDLLGDPEPTAASIEADKQRRRVLLSMTALSGDQRDELVERHGYVVTVEPSAGAAPQNCLVLDAAPGVRQTPNGLPSAITLQRLTNAEYQDLVADLRATNEAETPEPGWEHVPAEPTDPPSPDDGGTDPPHDPPTPESTAPAHTKARPEPARAAPEIRVLGRVEIAGRDLSDVEPGKRNLLPELACYLKLNPARGPDEVSRAMGGPRAPWSPSTRASNMSRLRVWLGRDPTGRNYVPAQGEGILYTLLNNVPCDWDTFQSLAQQGLQKPDGVDDLRAALDLVRGQPFSGGSPTSYIWAEYLKQEMISAITDVAHTIATRLTRLGDPAAARAAAAKGLDVEPGSELLYRDLFRAEYCAGNIAGITDAARRLNAINTQLGVDMEPDTADLLHRLLHTQRQTRARA